MTNFVNAALTTASAGDNNNECLSVPVLMAVESNNTGNNSDQK